MNEFKRIAELINKEKVFTVASHIGPDGDSLGATLALGYVLKKLKNKVDLCFGEERVIIPPQYNLFENIELIKSYKECKNNQVFISLECPQKSRLGRSIKVADNSEIIVNIDHHSDNHDYGDINFVDEKISSTCEILYDLFQILGIKIDKQLATYLYVGIVTDTGRFQYSNTSPKTLNIASNLLKIGVNSTEIFQRVYENRSLRSLKLLGMVLERTRTTPEGLNYSFITQDDFKLSNTKFGETEDYIDFLRATRKVNVAAIFKEKQNKEIKVSLRSRNTINVAKIAEKFGGGGHSAAAGYNTKSKLEESIEELKKEIKKST